jgi:hypothetical protein
VALVLVLVLASQVAGWRQLECPLLPGNYDHRSAVLAATLLPALRYSLLYKVFRALGVARALELTCTNFSSFRGGKYGWHGRSPITRGFPPFSRPPLRRLRVADGWQKLARELQATESAAERPEGSEAQAPRDERAASSAANPNVIQR